MREIYLSLTNHPSQLSLALPPTVNAISTGQRAVMLCGWGVKADMARVLVAGINCVILCITRVTPVRYRGQLVAISAVQHVYFTWPPLSLCMASDETFQITHDITKLNTYAVHPSGVYLEFPTRGVDGCNIKG